jgi:hypothetical protein
MNQDNTQIARLLNAKTLGLMLALSKHSENQPGFVSESQNSAGGRLWSRIVVTYDYKDEESQLLYQVIRYEPKDFRQRRPDGQGGWIWNLEGVRRTLYRLPELIEFSMQEWVIICEGEKDVDRLYELGFIATTCPMGAGKWSSEFNQYFKGRLVAIIPDNDSAGKRHTEQVANSLYGIASQVRIVELPEVPEKGDVSDWLDKGNSNKELIELIDKAIPYDPKIGIKIDVSKFKPLSSGELLETLGLTIKKDDENKLITFLCQLSTYTESSQINISFNAPSSTGKSYIPTEIARLFPEQDVIEIGYCSPTAFFHDIGQYVKELNGYIADLSRKIL